MCSDVTVQKNSGRSPIGTGFDDFYRREIGSLRAVAAGLTGSRELGADLAHEAMLRAFHEWGKVGVLDRPGAWVRRVLINLATDAHRRRVREMRALERLPVGGVSAPCDVVDDQFWQALRALPDLQRNAAVLFYVDDLAVERIAEVLNVASGTVKKALFNARRNLAHSLGTEDAEVMS